MRPSSVLLAILLFALAGTARAGAIGLPIDEGVCGEIEVATQSMADPNAVFDNAETPNQCEKLCKKAGKQCRSFTKKSTSCVLDLVKAQIDFQLDNCEIITDTTEAERECKSVYKGLEQNAKEVIKQERDDSLEDCEEWIDICIDTCVPSPV